MTVACLCCGRFEIAEVKDEDDVRGMFACPACCERFMRQVERREDRRWVEGPHAPTEP